MRHSRTRRRALVGLATAAAVAAGALVAIGVTAAPAPAAAPTVVSLTFDDGQASHLFAAQAMTARGLVGTFYVNSSFLGSSASYLTRTQVQSIARAGHEIGGHTATHVDVAAAPAAQARTEICGDRNALLGLGVGSVSSFAYPYGHVNPAAEQIVQQCGYASGRWVGYLGGNAGERVPPADRYALRTIDGAVTTTTVAGLQQAVLNAESRGGWLIMVFHGVCDNRCAGANSFGTAAFTTFLDWLAARRAGGTVVQTVGDVMAGVPPGPPTPGQLPPTTTTPTGPPGPTPVPVDPGPPTVTPGPAPQQGAGYWMATADGAVYAFGAAGAYGDAQAIVRPMEAAGARIVDLEPTPTSAGYWLADALGAVHAFGDARADLGGADLSPSQVAAGERVTSLSATPTGDGYWLFTDRGRAIARGDAPALGDVSSVGLNAHILDSVATPSGLGYWLVAADGGTFAFGDAAFHGSLGDVALNAPVRALVPTTSDRGYWLVVSDGGVFAFGDAGYVGSVPGVLTPGQALNRAISGMVPYGEGYLVVAEDGGIFAFSDRPFLGSLGDAPPDRPVVAVAST